MPSINPITLHKHKKHISGKFQAMASPCEILVQTNEIELANNIIQIAYKEAKRIEQKYSRFLTGNIIWQINNAKAKTVNIDEETYNLLNFATHCYYLSNGLFDISSGILRTLWDFKTIQKPPDKKDLKKLLKAIGWQNAELKTDSIKTPNGMQIDLGGIGKEYAVDNSAKLIRQTYPQIPTLINFGGDLCTSVKTSQPWLVGIDGFANKVIRLNNGALATSGSTKQFFIYKNIRYSHILNPKTGYPIKNAPLSVTILSENTVNSGIMATIAQLHGANAENFLQQQNIKYWCYK